MCLCHRLFVRCHTTTSRLSRLWWRSALAERSLPTTACPCASVAVRPSARLATCVSLPLATKVPPRATRPASTQDHPENCGIGGKGCVGKGWLSWHELHASICCRLPGQNDSSCPPTFEGKNNAQRRLTGDRRAVPPPSQFALPRSAPSSRPLVLPRR